MQQMLFAAAVALLSVVWWPTPYALAQDAKTARGVVRSLEGSALVVAVRGHDMTFKVDSTTSVEAPGAGTRSRAAAASGKRGPTLAELVKVGQTVAVTYHELNGVMQASRVRAFAATPASTDASKHRKAQGF